MFLGKNSQVEQYREADQKNIRGLSGNVIVPNPIWKIGITEARIKVILAALQLNNFILVKYSNERLPVYKSNVPTRRVNGEAIPVSQIPKPVVKATKTGWSKKLQSKFWVYR